MKVNLSISDLMNLETFTLLANATGSAWHAKSRISTPLSNSFIPSFSRPLQRASGGGPWAGTLGAAVFRAYLVCYFGCLFGAGL
jgi:hypothetical protein